MKEIIAVICALALVKADPVRTNIEFYDETDPKQAPVICALPNSDSVLVAHENCNQFYQCWDGKPIVRDCFGTLQYNPTTEVCDWPDKVDCGTRVVPEDGDSDQADNEVSAETDNSGNSGNGVGNCDPSQAGNICASVGSEGTLVAHENCNEYYICVNNLPVVQRCPGALLFDPFKDYCDWPGNVDCGSRVICEEEQVDSETENGDNDVNGNAGTGAGNCEPSQAGNICASEGSAGTLVAHENCNKYYICVNSLPVIQRCPGTLLFDPFKDYCDWSDNVDCGDRVICEEQENDVTGNENSDNNDDDAVTGAGNCDPSLAGNICATEGSDGTFVAHESCNKYYICDHGVPVTQNCPGSLLFDPFKDNCNWPENIDCGERIITEDNNGDGVNEVNSNENDNSGNVGSENGSSTCNCSPGQAPAICAVDGSDNTFIAHENCNQYYICAVGQTVAMTCPGNTLYNPYTEQCDWSDNVVCGERVIPEVESEEDNNGNGNGETDNGSSENGGSDNGGSGTCNCSPSEAPAICEVVGSDNTLIAHENCNQYYICAAGQPVVMKCPGNTLYNPYSEQCDWSDNVACGERLIPEVQSEEDNNGNEVGESEKGSSENGDSDNGSSGICNCYPSEASAICEVDGSDNTLIAHENCNQYYICAAGQPVVMKCPGNTLYNPYTEQCDWSDNVACGERVIPEEKSEEDNNENENVESETSSPENSSSENNGSENVGTDNGGSGTCNCNPGEAPSICKVDGSDNTFIAHENCNKYYICAAGQPVALTCPGTTLYNPYTKQCDWSDNVECGEREIPEVESIEDNNGNENGESENGSPESSSSENGGTDNESSGACNCNPGEALAICEVDGSDNTLIAHENCNQYYICAAGKPVALTCPGTTLYNPHFEQCDWSDNVECADRVIPEVEIEDDTNGNVNGETDNGSSENDVSENGGSDNGDSGICNCNPDEASSICAVDGSDGVLVAHENCNQFYTCVNGQTVTLTCPGTLLYNPYTEECDWSYNTECGDRVIPEAESGGDNNENGGTDNGGSENGGTGNGGADNGGTDNGGSGTCNCNPAEAPAICSVEGSDGVLIAHENCNQFYTCVDRHTVTLTCPGTLLYNPYTEECDWFYNVECGDRVIPEAESGEDNNENGGTDNGSSENGGTDNGDADNGGTDNGGSGICNCNPGEAPAICSLEDSDGVLIAHENCNQFYTCVDRHTVTLTCPGTLLYNPYTEECDWSYSVECGDRVIPEAESEEDNNENGETDNGGSEDGCTDNGGADNGGTDNGGSSTCNCNPGEAPAICAVGGSDGVLIAHENCNQFYTCVDGQTVSLKCPSPLLYNPYNEECDWSYNVECGDRVIPEAESEEDNNENGGTDNGSSENGGTDNGDADNGDTDNGGSGTCNCNPGEAPAICAVKGSDGVLIAHENCNQFYTCVDGQTVTFKCPSPLLYNPYNEECDWSYNVACGDRVIPEAESEEDNNENGGTDNGSSENGGTDNGEADNGDTDNGGSGTCNCNPSEAPAICAVESSDGVLIAHENCNQFYTCVDGQTVTLTCPVPLLYNPYNEECDWSYNVECGDRVIPEAESEEDNNENGGTDNGGSENGGTDNGGAENGGTDNGGSGTCNCNPVEAPAICAVKDSDGVLIAHENCKKFYTCVDGHTVTLTCPGTLLYNPYTEECDWSYNVECGDRVIPEAESEEDSNENDGTDSSGSENGSTENGGTDNGGSSTCNCNPGEAPAICAVEGSDGVIIAHENCNQFFTCIDRQTVTLTCPGTLLFNPYTEKCDWSYNVECGDRVIPEAESEEDNNENDGTDNGSSENAGTDNGGTDNGGSGTCNCNPSEAPAICAIEESDGVLIAHEKCNHFYTCIGGQTVAVSCPGTTLYNPYTQQCDWPQNVECGDRVIPEDCDENDDNSSIEESVEENDDGNNSSCNCNPAEAPAICAIDGSEGVLVAHENCNQFYTCVAGLPVTLKCTGTTLYNPYTQQCDGSENVECGERVIPEDCDENNNNDNDSVSESEESDHEGTEDESESSCNCNPNEASTICGTLGSEGTLIAHHHCNKFYTCVSGEPVTLSCPGITLYNPYTQRCVWPDSISCGDRIIYEDNDDDDSGNDSTSDKDSGNNDQNNIETDAFAICEKSGSEGVFLPHEKCNQFYVCIEGKPVVMNCANILLYNHNAKQCDWPENVNCGTRLIPSDLSEDIGEETDDVRVVDAYGDEDDKDNEQVEEREEVGYEIAAQRCAETGSAGVVVPHEECHRFYMCVSSRAIVFTCTSTNLFDIQRGQCNLPENVDCRGRIVV